nr:YGSC-1 [Lymnaea stagnalis]
MKTFGLLAILALGAVTSRAEVSSTMSDLELKAHEDIVALLRHVTFARPKKPVVDPIDKKKGFGLAKSFSFKNCADPDNEILVPSNFNLEPDPIRAPGNITVSGNLEIKSKFGSPLVASVVVWKKVLGIWIKIPCYHGVGSCTYSDACTLLTSPDCPTVLTKIGLPCQCPFPAGTFNFEPFDIVIPKALPVSGEIFIHLKTSYEGSLVTCVDLQFELA